MITYVLIASALTVLVLFAWMRERRLHRRPLLLAEILDLADALERDLLECRARLRELPALAVRLAPADPVSARATLAAEPQVQDALRDLLAHRLWLKEHAEDAAIDALIVARDALVATRTSLAVQLMRLANVRADVERSASASP